MFKDTFKDIYKRCIHSRPYKVYLGCLLNFILSYKASLGEDTLTRVAINTVNAG